MNIKLRTLLSAGVIALGPVAFGQQYGDAGNGAPSDSGRLYDTRLALDNLDLPAEAQELRDDILVLREALAASRQEIIDSLAEDATPEERRLAIEEWRDSASTVAAITEIQELNAELRDMLVELGIVPEREVVEIPEEIQEARDAMHELAASLAESRRAVIDALPEDATIEDRQAALAEWRTENAESIAQLEAYRAEVTTWFQENRPDRGDRPGRAFLRERMENFREGAAALRTEREQLRVALANAETEAERRQLIREFRARTRTLMQERKELKRLERLADDDSGGDVRPGE